MSKNVLDLGAQFGESNLTNTEVYLYGVALVNWLGATVRLGHANPGSLLDYTTDPTVLPIGTLVVRDFVAWTSGRTDLVEGCEERLRQLADAADLEQHFAASADAHLAAIGDLS